uniref:F-box only protein 34 n=1 Tax=Macrostomum lignano TaxID=282301 RepID=A0A1I8FBY0_9PLAT
PACQPRLARLESGKENAVPWAIRGAQAARSRLLPPPYCWSDQNLVSSAAGPGDQALASSPRQSHCQFFSSESEPEERPLIHLGKPAESSDLVTSLRQRQSDHGPRAWSGSEADNLQDSAGAVWQAHAKDRRGINFWYLRLKITQLLSGQKLHIVNTETSEIPKEVENDQMYDLSDTSHTYPAILYMKYRYVVFYWEDEGKRTGKPRQHHGVNFNDTVNNTMQMDLCNRYGNTWCSKPLASICMGAKTVCSLQDDCFDLFSEPSRCSDFLWINGSLTIAGSSLRTTGWILRNLPCCMLAYRNGDAVHGCLEGDEEVNEDEDEIGEKSSTSSDGEPSNRTARDPECDKGDGNGRHFTTPIQLPLKALRGAPTFDEQESSADPEESSHRPPPPPPRLSHRQSHQQQPAAGPQRIRTTECCTRLTEVSLETTKRKVLAPTGSRQTATRTKRKEEFVNVEYLRQHPVLPPSSEAGRTVSGKYTKAESTDSPQRDSYTRLSQPAFAGHNQRASQAFTTTGASLGLRASWCCRRHRTGASRPASQLQLPLPRPSRRRRRESLELQAVKAPKPARGTYDSNYIVVPYRNLAVSSRQRHSCQSMSACGSAASPAHCWLRYAASIGPSKCSDHTALRRTCSNEQRVKEALLCATTGHPRPVQDDSANPGASRCGAVFTSWIRTEGASGPNTRKDPRSSGPNTPKEPEDRRERAKHRRDPKREQRLNTEGRRGTAAQTHPRRRGEAANTPKDARGTAVQTHREGPEGAAAQDTEAREAAPNTPKDPRSSGPNTPKDPRSSGPNTPKDPRSSGPKYTKDPREQRSKYTKRTRGSSGPNTQKGPDEQRPNTPKDLRSQRPKHTEGPGNTVQNTPKDRGSSGQTHQRPEGAAAQTHRRTRGSSGPNTPKTARSSGPNTPKDPRKQRPKHRRNRGRQRSKYTKGPEGSGQTHQKGPDGAAAQTHQRTRRSSGPNTPKDPTEQRPKHTEDPREQRSKYTKGPEGAAPKHQTEGPEEAAVQTHRRTRGSSAQIHEDPRKQRPKHTKDPREQRPKHTKDRGSSGPNTPKDPMKQRPNHTEGPREQRSKYTEGPRCNTPLGRVPAVATVLADIGQVPAGGLQLVKVLAHGQVIVRCLLWQQVLATLSGACWATVLAHWSGGLLWQQF